MKSKPFPLAWAFLAGTGLAVAHASGAETRGDAARPAEAAVESPSAGHIHSGMHSEEEALKEAVWYAAAEGNVDLLRRLLRDNEVDVDATTVGQLTTALWIASQQGHGEVVRLLLARGADIEATDGFDRRTPLFQAAQEGHAEVVEILLEHGAEVEVRSDRTGATPLFVASARGHAEVVRLLVAAEADVTAAASAGEGVDTPLSIARTRRHAEVVALLEDATAEGGAVVH